MENQQRRGRAGQRAWAAAWLQELERACRGDYGRTRRLGGARWAGIAEKEALSEGLGGERTAGGIARRRGHVVAVHAAMVGLGKEIEEKEFGRSGQFC